MMHDLLLGFSAVVGGAALLDGLIALGILVWLLRSGKIKRG